VANGGAPTLYTIEKHALWCLFLEKALPIGRGWRRRLPRRSVT